MQKNTVICAINVNDYDQDVVDMAAMMAKHFDVGLDLLHVTLFPNTANVSVYNYVGETSVVNREKKRLDEIQTEVDGVEISRHHLSGDPAELVVSFAQKWEPKLLVLGTHGRRGLARVFGSVATDILRKADCPVMVLRQDQNDQSFTKNEPDSINA